MNGDENSAALKTDIDRCIFLADAEEAHASSLILTKKSAPFFFILLIIEENESSKQIGEEKQKSLILKELIWLPFSKNSQFNAVFIPLKIL